MQRKTMAELFIATLAEMLDTEREIRRAQRLSRHRANARRYMQAFPAAFDENRTQIVWTRRKGAAGQPSVPDMWLD